MKKLIIAVAVVVAVLFVIFLKHQGSQSDGLSSTHKDLVFSRTQGQIATANPVEAIDGYVTQHPTDPAVPQLQRLSTALKARPEIQKTALAQYPAQSVQDGAVSTPEAAMVSEAAALAERATVTESEINMFSVRYAALNPAQNPVDAIETFVAKNPADPAVPQLQRLSAAMKAKPAIQKTVLAEYPAHSVQDNTVSTQEAVMLTDAAALAEKENVTESEMKEFSTRYAALNSTPDMSTDLKGIAAVEHYIQQNPSGKGVAPLRRILITQKARPAQTQVLTQAAIHSVEDGTVTAQEVPMLEEAAKLAEQNPVKEHDVKAFAARYPAATTPTTAATAAGSPSTAASVTASSAGNPTAALPVSASVVKATQAIDTYLQRHPEGRGAAQLRRLSKAIKTRPAQNQVLAETAARSLKDGTVSKKDEAMLEDAVTLAEQEGLSPREMAEFSSKYRHGIGLTNKPSTAVIADKEGAAPLASFEGNRQLVYTFQGVVTCAKTACVNLRVSVRVTSGKWVETRQDGVDGKGHYVLQMPVLSAINEKVRWTLEAHDKDLRKVELAGQRTTTSGDSDVNVDNNLVLNPV